MIPSGYFQETHNHSHTLWCFTMQTSTLTMSNKATYTKTFGKRGDVCAIFKFSVDHVKMGLGPKTLPYQEIGSLHRLYWAYHFFVGISLPFRLNQCMLLCPPSVHVWEDYWPTLLFHSFPQWKEQSPLPTTWDKHMWIITPCGLGEKTYKP